jgi:hypothetical protein
MRHITRGDGGAAQGSGGTDMVVVQGTGGWPDVGVGVSGPEASTWVGMVSGGDKNIRFLAETLFKLRFLWSFHLFVIIQPDGWVRREG